MTIIMFNKSKPHVFVKGAFNDKTKHFGGGGILLENDNLHLIQTSGLQINKTPMVDIEGEMKATVMAVEKAVKLGLSSIQIIHSHPGIKEWTKYAYKPNNKIIESYQAKMRSRMNQINIKFVEAKNVSNGDGKEIADKLAKCATGIR